MWDGAEPTTHMLFTKKHYFMLSRSMGSGSRRLWTRKRRHVAAELTYMAFWLLLAVGVLAMVPWLKTAGAEFTIDPIVAVSSDY